MSGFSVKFDFSQEKNPKYKTFLFFPNHKIYVSIRMYIWVQSVLQRFSHRMHLEGVGIHG